MHLKDDIDDVTDWYVAMVRSFVVSPAQVDAHTIFGNIGKRMIERLDVDFEVLAKFSSGRIGELYMTPHREVRTIDLENESGLMDCVVLRLHGVGECRQIRF